MPDTLSITLEVSDDRATATLTGFERRAHNTAANINRAGNQINFGRGIVRSLEDAERQISSFSNKFNSLVLGAVGLGAGFAVIAGGIKAVIDKTNEASRANRLLASTATEAGLAADVLSEKNKKVAESFGLSNAAAASVTAKIQQLATFTGNPAQFDLLQKRFADLAAAKGIDSSQLSDLIGSILSGQDEGLNRLGISDPGKLYEAYAKQIGKTTESLTQFEKVQATVNAVVEKGAIFDGSAEARMNSLEGATARAASTYENLTSNLSQATTGNLYFQNSLDLINKSLLSVSFNIDEVRAKLKQGLTPEQIAYEEQGSFLNGLLNITSSAGNAIFGLPFLGYDIYDKGAGEAFRRYGNTINPFETDRRLVEQRAQQIRNQQVADSKQERDALAQKEKNENRTSVDALTSKIDSFLKPAGDGVAKARVTLEDLKKIRREFAANIADFGGLDSDQARATGKKIFSLAQKFYTQDAEENLTRFFRNPDFEGAKQNLETLRSVERFLPAEKFDALSDKLNDFIEKDLEKATSKVKEFEKQFLSTFSNLFQKTGAENPVFTAFNESGKALKDLRENLRGLPAEIQAVALAMQEKLNLKARLEAGLNTQLSILDLRQDAANFRNPFDGEKQKKEQDEFLLRFFRNNPNYAFLNGIPNGTSLETLNPAIRANMLKRFAPGALTETPADRLNKSFDERFNTLYKPRQSALEQSVADKLFIGLTNGANPLDLSAANRDRAASAREREAVRQEHYQAEAVQLSKDQLAVQRQIAENTKRGLAAAEKGGSAAVEITVKDDTTAGVKSALQPAASARDTADAYYDPDLSFGGAGGFSNR